MSTGKNTAVFDNEHVWQAQLNNDYFATYFATSALQTESHGNNSDNILRRIEGNNRIQKAKKLHSQAHGLYTNALKKNETLQRRIATPLNGKPKVGQLSHGCTLQNNLARRGPS